MTPPGFFGLEIRRTFDMALPICSDQLGTEATGASIRHNLGLTVIGRLKPGMSMERAGVLCQASSTGIFEATPPSDYPPVSVRPHLAMKLLALPAVSGVSRLREQYSGH